MLRTSSAFFVKGSVSWKLRSRYRPAQRLVPQQEPGHEAQSVCRVVVRLSVKSEQSAQPASGGAYSVGMQPRAADAAQRSVRCPLWKEGCGAMVLNWRG
jgi:hypothetical protein